DILMFGGIALGREQAEALNGLILDFKSQYRPEADFPIKWNFKDLQQWYRDRNLMPLYDRLLAESKEWRSSLINKALSIDFRIVAACVLFHSKKLDKIKENRRNVVKYTFCNALMRVGLHAQDIKATHIEIVLDWPDGNVHTPYTEEYRSAYLHGCCHASPDIKYFSGPLKALGFDEALYFTRMEDCSLLQFSDLLLGTTREFIDFALGKKTLDHLGVQMTRCLIPKYRGFPGRIIGRGLSVAPTDGQFSKKLFDAMVQIRKL
ncbi:hypothetical protein MUP79_03705, partial [Candidatus Bathyarchaeota archaeon]|nr:hypothetical protein [Candidatus Bathyarchaeota archaeon]